MHEIPNDRQFLFQALIEKYQTIQATMQRNLTTLVRDTAVELGLDPDAAWQVTRGPNGWVLQEGEVSE